MYVSGKMGKRKGYSCLLLLQMLCFKIVRFKATLSEMNENALLMLILIIMTQYGYEDVCYTEVIH